MAKAKGLAKSENDKNSASTSAFLRLWVEGLQLNWFQLKRIRMAQSIKRSSHCNKAWNKTTKKVCKTKEGLHLLVGGRLRNQIQIPELVTLNGDAFW